MHGRQTRRACATAHTQRTRFCFGQSNHGFRMACLCVASLRRRPNRQSAMFSLVAVSLLDFRGGGLWNFGNRSAVMSGKRRTSAPAIPWCWSCLINGFSEEVVCGISEIVLRLCQERGEPRHQPYHGVGRVSLTDFLRRCFVEFRKSFCGYVRKEENLGISHTMVLVVSH